MADPAPTARLTRRQARILAAVRAGPRVYNARVRRPIERLQALGLVSADWDADLDEAKGRLRWRITVKAVLPAGRQPEGGDHDARHDR
jgi:hypothetical protein